MRLASLLLLPLLLSTAGCKALYQDVDEDYWKIEEDNRPFLGVVVQDPQVTEPGARVDRVLRDSPAAHMGLQQGDLIVRCGALRVHDCADLASAMRQVGVKKVEFTVERGDDEAVLSGDLETERDYAWRANGALRGAEQRGETHLPFLFRSRTWAISQGDWGAWTGFTPTEPVVVYSETNVMPILEFFSLCCVETTPCRGDRTRVMVLTWPLIFTSSEGDEEEERRDIDAARKPDAQWVRL
jgi:hypothetical protein